MKKIRLRSFVVLFPAVLILFGLGALLARLWLHGGEWAAYSANEHIYRGGVLAGGTLTDRNGVVLFTARDGEYRYADEEAVRFASLHAVGDQRGMVGGTALGAFSDELIGYSFARGSDGRGGEIALSLDCRLQAGAWYALNGRRGAVVVLNYETGEILCMVSSPSYDPAVGERRDADGLYVNRCTNGLFIPGSIYKLVTLCCACRDLPDLKSRVFHCDGELTVNGKTVHCTGVHGDQTVEDALANSCNAAFAALSMELGGARIRDTARDLGVEGTLSWGGGTTAPGRFDVAARRTAPEAWSGIGQYNDLVTPYAMARLCAAVANGGTVHEGVLRAGGVGKTRRLMDEKTAAFMGECMRYNVTHSYGTNNFPWLDIAAKTGTAEMNDGSTHAWFVGYLRSGAPLAFAVLLEKGGGGLAQAGPVANHVLQLANGYYAS